MSAILKALERAAVYRILGGAFAYPTAPQLEELGRSAVTTAGAAGLAEELRDTLLAFGRAAREADPATVTDEHVFLFDRQVRCPPYEGAWGEGPQMAGKSAALADIAGFYAAFGLGPGAAQPDTEDHIVAELEFMSALALKEAWARGADEAEGLEITRRAEAAFLADHLGRWAGTFADEVRAATPLPYYAAAADLLAAWIRSELEGLGVAPHVLAGRPARDPLQEDCFTCPMMEPAPEPAIEDDR